MLCTPIIKKNFSQEWDKLVKLVNGDIDLAETVFDYYNQKSEVFNIDEWLAFKAATRAKIYSENKDKKDVEKRALIQQEYDNYLKNKVVFPTAAQLEKALNSLMANQSLLSGDTKVVLENQLIELEGQLPYLTKAAKAPNLTVAQVQTIEAIINNSLKYINLIKETLDKLEKSGGRISEKDRLEIIRVTSYIGSPVYRIEAIKTISYTNFGTFVHNVAEKIINRLSDKKLTPYTYEEFKNDLKSLEGTDKDFTLINKSDETQVRDLYEQTLSMTAKAASFIKEGYKLLPEIRIMGQNISQSIISGRTDLILISPSGKVKIIDYKTKKIRQNLTKVTSPEDLYKTMIDQKEQVKTLLGTNPKFQQNRSKLMTYATQLKVYENLFLQAGIQVEDSEVVIFLYEINQTANGVELLQNSRQAIVNTNALVMSQMDNLVTGKKTVAGNIYQSMNDIVDRDIPLDPDIKSKRLKEANKVFPFDLSEDQWNSLKEEIKRLYESAKQQLNVDFRQAKKDNNKELLNTLNARRINLNSFYDLVLKGDINVASSLKALAVLNVLETDMINISKRISALNQNIEDIINNRTSKEEQNKYASEMNILLRSMKNFETLYQTFEVQVAQAKQTNPELNYAELDLILKKLNNIFVESESQFTKFLAYNVISIVSSQNLPVFYKRNPDLDIEPEQKYALEQIAKDVKDFNEPEINFHKRKQEAILNKYPENIQEMFKKTDNVFKNSAVIDAIKQELRQLTDYKNIVNDFQDYRNRAYYIEAAKTKELVAGLYTGSKEDLINLLKNITRPDAFVYLGASDAQNSNSTIEGVRPGAIPSIDADSWQATAASGNPVIASLTLFLKNAELQSQQDFINNPLIIDFSRKEQELKTKNSVSEMNQSITEKRNIQFYNNATESTSTKTALSLINPVSESYEQEYNAIRNNQRLNYKKLRGLITERADLISNKATQEKIDDIKKQITEVRLQIEKSWENMLSFMKDRSIPRYSPDFVEYLESIPSDVKLQIQEKYEEINLLLRVNSEEELELGNEDEMEEWETINQLRIEIKKLRRDALESSGIDIANKDYYQKFFTSIMNIEQFERVKRNKQLQYANEPEKYERWLLYNTVEEYDDSWQEMRNLILDEINSLSPREQASIELFKQKARLLKIHRNGKTVDTRFMTDKEVAEYDRIEKEIDKIKQEARSEKQKSSLATDEKIKALWNQYFALEEKAENPFYRIEKQERLEKMSKAKQRLAEAAFRYDALVGAGSSEEELDVADNQHKLALKQYNKETIEFEKWFKRNHNVPYYPENPMANVKSLDDVKSFNIITRPSQEFAHLIKLEQPHPKYSTRRRKDAVENEDYKESPDGVPLPKALTYNDKGDVVLNNKLLDSLPSSEKDRLLKDVNPRFLKLLTEPENLEFYNTIVRAYFTMQNKISGTKNGYIVPGLSPEIRERIFGKSFSKMLKDESARFLDNFRKTSEEDLLNNIFGDNGRQIRLRNNNQYSEELQSNDAINAIKLWLAEAHYNISMQKATPSAENMITFFESQMEQLRTLADFASDENKKSLEKKYADMAQIVKIARFEVNKFSYGITKDDTARQAGKILNMIMSASSTIRIGFDLAVQTKNFISGNVQAFLAGESSNHWGTEDYLWAKRNLYKHNGFIHKFLNSFGKVHDIDPEIALYRFMDPAQKGLSNFLKDTTGTSSRTASNIALNPAESSHFMQDMGDTEIAITIWMSIMHSYKAPLIDPITKEFVKDSKGQYQYIPVYDAFLVNSEGQLVIRDDVQLTMDEVNSIRNIAIGEYRRTQGNYAQSDKTRMESFTVGSIMYFYKKYLIPMAMNRLGYMKLSLESKEATVGYFYAMYRIFKFHGIGTGMKNLLLAGVLPEEKYNSGLNPLYYKKAVHASKDLWASILLSIGALSTVSYVKAKADDDEEINLITGNLIRILWGVEKETLSMNPIPVVGGADEYIRNFTSMTSLTREALLIGKTLHHALATMSFHLLGGKENDLELEGVMKDILDSFEKQALYQARSGVYEKGDYKILKDFHDLTGFKNFRDLFNPNEKLQMMMKQTW